nr:fumarylacetoacetate hydrolase family protein [Saprospiraceae bacterium]
MKIFCIGRNYSEHILELKNETPDEPVVFMKPPSALLVQNKPFYIPEFTNEVHHEIELVIKICKNGKLIQPQFASRYFKEIALGIDFTARDLQSKLKKKGLPWELAKAFDKSAPISEFVTVKSLGKGPIDFRLEKNGRTVQSGDHSQMIHSFSQLIVFISKFFTLQMGDLIYTGTPAGVGPVKVGDQLEGFLKEKSMLNCEIK